MVRRRYRNNTLPGVPLSTTRGMGLQNAVKVGARTGTRTRTRERFGGGGLSGHVACGQGVGFGAVWEHFYRGDKNKKNASGFGHDGLRPGKLLMGVKLTLRLPRQHSTYIHHTRYPR